MSISLRSGISDVPGVSTASGVSLGTGLSRTGAVTPPPTSGRYVAEDGVSPYVSENGANNYVTES